MMEIEKLDEPDAHVSRNPASSTTRRAQLWPVIILSARNLCRIASYQLFLKKHRREFLFGYLCLRGDQSIECIISVYPSCFLQPSHLGPQP